MIANFFFSLLTWYIPVMGFLMNHSYIPGVPVPDYILLSLICYLGFLLSRFLLFLYYPEFCKGVGFYLT